ncbi:unnamed protein product [Didymodactylos carnosus]|uniref:Uncharacterized protein n=1 Tax=Didymodactylos carnosus TaxID=1234261 RepID=A0A8S2D2T8_9BILA|nr:unnamed protein product [Didymodactylos carnosus]CAF3648878.1 unnamed protein product [Didymodactylos carnosus]
MNHEESKYLQIVFDVIDDMYKLNDKNNNKNEIFSCFNDDERNLVFIDGTTRKNFHGTFNIQPIIVNRVDSPEQSSTIPMVISTHRKQDETSHQTTQMDRWKQDDYENRLRYSLTKLQLPEWFNHDYVATPPNELRKTKSHGTVGRCQTLTNNFNGDHTNSNSNTNSPKLFVRNCRQRSFNSPTRSWSGHNSIKESSSELFCRRSVPMYIPGKQRVAQSSNWYKPVQLPLGEQNTTTNNHPIKYNPVRNMIKTPISGMNHYKQWNSSISQTKGKKCVKIFIYSTCPS